MSSSILTMFPACLICSIISGVIGSSVTTSGVWEPNAPVPYNFRHIDRNARKKRSILPASTRREKFCLDTWQSIGIIHDFRCGNGSGNKSSTAGVSLVVIVTCFHRESLQRMKQHSHFGLLLCVVCGSKRSRGTVQVRRTVGPRL